MGTRTGNPPWQNTPSTATPIDSPHLQNIEAALDASAVVITRSNVVINTGVLAANATAGGTAPAHPSEAAIAIVVSGACRLRLYASTAQRDADISRPRGQDPDPTTNHGVLLDMAFTGATATPWTISPPAILALVPFLADLPWSITNLGPTPVAIQATLTVVPLEQ